MTTGLDGVAGDGANIFEGTEFAGLFSFFKVLDCGRSVPAMAIVFFSSCRVSTILVLVLEE